ncbi:Uncharacterised protein [uncultured Clostridium sp.]|nr:Uncharacterised protein [uncultured Clostridium sp.]
MSDDRSFDQMVEDGMSAVPPPAEVLEEITPWKRALRRVVWGVGLTTILIHFLWLQYLLPTAGLMLMWLGFRTLRRENGWFALGWAISLYRVMGQFFRLLANATLLRIEGTPTWMYLTLLIPLLQYICLWQGIRAVQRKAGQEQRAGAAGALVVFYLLLTGLAFLDAEGWPMLLVLLVCYIALLRNLARLANLLDGAGYEVKAAPVRLSDRTVCLSWLGALLVCLPLATLLFGRFPMEWVPRPAGEQTGWEETAAHLLDLGVPEDVTSDLAPEDLADCAESIRAVVEQREFPMNKGREVRETVGNSTHISRVYDVYELRLTSVALELPDGRWKVIQHFLWQEEPKVRGTESIRLQIAAITAESQYAAWEEYPTEFSGRLLYDREGQTFTGEYTSLGWDEYTSRGFSFGPNPQRDMSAQFSLPLWGENCRGYVSYVGGKGEDKIYFLSQMDYTHQNSWLCYPLLSAWEHRQIHLFDDETFKTVQMDLMAGPED